ncbi:hypothetical protein [Pantoea sp. BAV 3049]|uniref:beta strand repeat-containing protein n=1 Tax=Pantoea sp. BAV 3049 TaxID=2654188 RepID=UPI00131ADA40|nr:hypothetical protein [Pantoea sp. BAV 3049]
MNNKKGKDNIKVLSACIALAISQGAMADNPITSRFAAVSDACPADPSRLSPAEYASLPAECQVEKSASQWAVEHAVPLSAAGIAAVAATIAVVSSGGGGSSGHHSSSDSAPDSQPEPQTDPDSQQPGPELQPSPDSPQQPDAASPWKEWKVGETLSGDSRENSLESDVAAGAGTVGQLITGNNTVNTVTGNTSVSGGGKGTVVKGDNTSTIIEGDSVVSGEGSAGLVVNGNAASLRQNGDLEIDGGTGIAVSGNDARVKLNGDMTVDAGGTGLLVTGENNAVAQNGSLQVTGGATGINMLGNRAVLNNTGNITVRDSDSVGLKISSDNASLNDNGNIYVSDSATGILLSGNHNQVTLDGTVSLNFKGNKYPQPDNKNGQKGVVVNGSDNTIAITGGLNLNYAGREYVEEALQSHNVSVYALDVAGENNTITLRGASDVTVTGTFSPYSRMLGYINVTGKGNTLLLDDDSVLNFYAHDIIPVATGTDISAIFIDGSTLINKGSIIISRGGGKTISGANATIINSGGLSFRPGLVQEIRSSSLVWLQGSQFQNASDGLLDVVSVQDAVNSLYYYPEKESIDYLAGLYGVNALDSSALNEGTINVSGQNAYGMAAGNNGTAINNGLISLNAMSNSLDGDGHVLYETGLWKDATNYRRGVAMLANSPTSVVINTGEISVNNAGMGMVASDGTAINRGVITLTSDNADADALYAMAAVNNGMALNDTDGVININTDKGYAFYSEGNGRIINRGTVNLSGTIITNTDNNWGSVDTPFTGDFLDNTVITAAGDRQTIMASGSGGSWYLSANVDNDGSATYSRPLTAAGWLQNSGQLASTSAVTSAEINNTGTLNANSVTTTDSLLNSGSITSAKLTSANLHNHGSITADALNVTGNLVNYKEGAIAAGQINGTSNTNNLVNQGEITGKKDGAAVISGALVVYNEASGTIRNTGSAVDGSANSLINITYTLDSLNLYNRGELIASNGYNAISLAATNANNAIKWLYNTETGKISGDSPANPLISLTRGYGFLNAGEINVTGDNAVAIGMGASNYDVYAMNAGVINVGTKEGKANGTNGTGLVGILAQGSGNIINNTLDGVINVWANDSVAFASTSTGTRAKIYNNGTVNLMCESGCGVFQDGVSEQQGRDGRFPSPDSTPTISIPKLPADSPLRLSSYVIGTNSDGTAGTLSARSLVIDNDVTVDTGFASSTSAKAVTFSNVIQADSISGEQNIGSGSVVWKASASKNAQGNVDVTMSKNDYASVADASVRSVAVALDNGYTNNSLFSSLNLATSGELTRALKQISGSQATNLNHETRILGQRFSMLAETAPVIAQSGLSFNVVAQGDRRAEMDN